MEDSTVQSRKNTDALVSVGGWCFEAAANTLTSAAGEVVRLEDKVAALLALLCDRRGQVVSRADIVKVVWDGRAVSEQTVPVAISKLRKALSEDGADTPLIETVPKRGYRLRDEEAAVAAPAEVRRRGLWRVLGVAAVILLVVGGFWPRGDGGVVPPAAAEKPSIILTLKDIRAPAGTEEDLTRAVALSELASYYLSRVPEVLVIRHWWNFDAPDPTGGIYTRYGTDTPVYLITGTLIDEGGVSVVLLALSVPMTEEVIWSGMFRAEAGAERYFALLGDMVERVGARPHAVADAARLPADFDFWQGRYLSHLSNPGAAKGAALHLRAALAKKPDDTMAANSLAALAARWPGVADDAPVTVQPFGADHMAAVDAAVVLMYRGGDAAGAIPFLDEALALAPGDHYALSLLAEARVRTGDIAGALEAYEKAIRLAPFARAYEARVAAIQSGETN
ncbi:winged helix-turn-helix domain-containing protein [Kordiimonas aestuarii]|uniref:winged helix-turn-helix domain-containing protein n=1 Tax=Kordiimonas aestuarii TaxID=1005925 RepID=UPI0021D09185|nr:winged helix-turn-helix domain-containing protein [Kordiimonas aestuarii]